MGVFNGAKWIWAEQNAKPDTYGEFYQEFIWNGGRAVCHLSVDGDYTLFINGKFVASNQYGDFEWYKSYDTVDVTPYLSAGVNKIAVLVWYFGTDSQRYIKAQAGLIFEVKEAGQVRVESGESTLCRYSRAYGQGRKKEITKQLGYSFLYDATKEDDWLNGSLEGFAYAVAVQKQCRLVPRPNEKLQLLAPPQGKTVCKQSETRFVIDLGSETVGLLSFSFTSSAEQKIVISYGEDLQNGGVRRLIGDRDFSVEYVAKKGQNDYVHYMLRLGCRYLVMECESPVDLHYLTVMPQVYPVKVKPYTAKDERAKAIYELCVNSLKLCMMEHYVDCPWREQCLYAFDSRNQMLCGYEAFEGGNAAYARSNLLLMNEDRYPSGLMSICYPCGMDMTIPSFSLYYTLSVKEYVEYTGDTTLVRAVFPRICRYMDAFLSNRKNGLVYRFKGAENWNFYDWSKGSDGQFLEEEKSLPDAQINILTIMALTCLREICLRADLLYPYQGVEQELKQRTREAFYDDKEGAFSAIAGGQVFVEIVNALAVRFDIVSGKEAENICEKLAAKVWEQSSLSMKCFTYDALLKTNKEKYRDAVLSDIYANYGKMLAEGATATWETMDGAAAFENAGSLCHGWSAIPVYYLRKLNVIE